MKVGDYVRTRDGIISKIEDNFNTTMCISTDRGKYHYEYFDIIKSSPNIIDLIQVGDFVNLDQINGGIVINKIDDEIDTWSILPNRLKNENIKSVITREQLLDMEYKVVE